MPQANRLTIHIMSAFAEHEREIISERTKAAMAAAKARGIRFGNPRWHESIERARAAPGYRPPPDEVLRLMADWCRRDTLRAIADRLNSLNIRTPQGFRWHASTVRAAFVRACAHEHTDAMVDGLMNARAHALHNATALQCGSTTTDGRNDAWAQTSQLQGASATATPACQPSAPGEGLPMQEECRCRLIFERPRG
jgi:hypothetical protein